MRFSGFLPLWQGLTAKLFDDPRSRIKVGWLLAALIAISVVMWWLLGLAAADVWDLLAAYSARP